MTHSGRVWALLGSAAAMLAATPHAPESICPPGDQPMDDSRYLRSLSLDLRGYTPDLSELETLQSGGRDVDAFIDAWLDSEDFAERVVRHHRALLWNNITNVNLTANSFVLSTSSDLYYRRNPALTIRGDRVPCLDEPARFDDSGMPIASRQSDGTMREGYVWISPYWAPETSIKVCAYDAQTHEFASSGQPCDQRNAGDEIECGCGPDLNWCSYGRSTDEVVLASLGEDLELRITAMIDEDRPYTDLFDGRTAYVNGPIVHHLKNKLDVFQNTSLAPSAYRAETLPDLNYTDVDTWLPVELDDQHAGILTSPAFLIRFQTNRARANRFYNAFLCQPFQPPSGGLPATDESQAPPLDLQVRDGCKYCHALLEPSAAYWGRWAPSGAGFLDPDTFPAQRDDCLACAEGSGNCSQDCRDYYLVDALTDEQEPYLGWLNAYEFRRSEHMVNVEAGPRVLAAQGVVDGRLPECVSRNTFTWLMGRAPLAEEEAWLDDLTLSFVRSNYSYRHLVRDIVTSDTYRRIQ